MIFQLNKNSSMRLENLSYLCTYLYWYATNIIPHLETSIFQTVLSFARSTAHLPSSAGRTITLHISVFRNAAFTYKIKILNYEE